MRVRAWSKVAVLGLLCAVMFCSGCSWFRHKKKTTDQDIVNPLPLPGDYSQESRVGFGPGEGERITTPESQIENVLFDYDSYQIKASEMAKVDKAAEFLTANDAVRLIAEGNCDERGSAEYNMSLGEHRADAVRAALIGKGIDGTRITTRSYGKENPLDTGHNEAAWRVNRRVEFAFFK